MCPDITKCSGKDCPHKEGCYRFTATPNEFRQSYFFTPPIDENGKCDHYWGDNPETIWKTIPENN